MRISLASPEEIRSWSYGEVTKPETINYRRLRPEKDGLFCEAIFGPTKDYQCYCGKYKKIRYRGIVCEKCGVEVTRSRVRRERMGHIELASPVAHIWYTRRVPSYLGLLLDISRRNLDRILYFAQYIINHVDEEARQKALRRLDEEIAREMERVEGEAQEQIDQITFQLEEEIAGLEGTASANRQQLEEQLEAATNEVMTVAAQVQKSLEDRRDGPVPVPVIFAPSQTVIVEQGGMITREHFSLLKQTVDAKLSEIEAGIREEEERERLLVEADVDRLRHEADERIEALTRQMENEVKEIQEKVEALRAELKSLAPRQLLVESEYQELNGRWGGVFRAGMGAEALYDLLNEMNLEAMAKELRREIRLTKSKQRRKKATKRLRVVEALRRSENRPEWMVLTVLPVIPPDLRPMVQLDGGRFATSDLNDLYRRVINRNNRLKRLLELGAPDVIIRNEKRMLQESVDSLVDNSRRGKAVSTRGRRQLKSLSDMLKGKQGRFRRNLLGKRVDYSGRSVIVVGPHLKLHQCGLPKSMALELFRPFVMRKLVEYGHVHNVKGAKRLIERMSPEVWEVLEEVIRDYPILLNRAPTLHRLGIQAFQPVLVEGSAIQIHPLVCAAFNADFDGDQMAVHIPLSRLAKEEAWDLMLSRHNLLLPANGEPIVNPTKDMVLGCYYLTMEREGARGEGKVFADLDEVDLAYSLGKVDLHASIRVEVATYYMQAGGRYSGERRKRRLVETTVGRALFNQILPEKMRYVNELLDKGKLKELVAEAYRLLGQSGTAELVDRIKEIGFKYATRSGLTIAVEDITVPEAKARILGQVSSEVAEIERQYRRGLITEDEQYVKTVELWTKATDDITEAVAEAANPHGPVRVMAVSGATKGGFQPIRQLAGMRGLMADPAGRIIALPIRSNFREGLSTLEYFISTHGARKGLADTALRTADAGYLTRRLVDVAQESIVNAHDCGTKGGIWIRPRGVRGVGETMAERLYGRIAAAPVVHPETGEILAERGKMIEEEQIAKIERAGIQEVYVRSPLACQMRHGVCAMCYGQDLARGGLVQIGEAVGVIAAQSIGEPGTQLTLRTFHTGGVAGVEDITHGLPRVQELFEARKPKGEALISDIAGMVEIYRQEDGLRYVRVVDRQEYVEEYPRLRGGYKTLVQEGDRIENGTVLARLARSDMTKEIVARVGGTVILEKDRILVRREEREEREYVIPAGARLRVEEGQQISAGQSLTEGPLNPHRILSILGREATQEYLVTEIQKVYRSQGVNIKDKHIEMIIRQMMSKVRVRSGGDTRLLPGDLVDWVAFEEINAGVMETSAIGSAELADVPVEPRGGTPATARPILLGITKAALKTESFLSAASFQHTINVLAEAAIEGKVDELHGLKENVILGKLIPAGTGFRAPRGKDLDLDEVPPGEAQPPALTGEEGELPAEDEKLGAAADNFEEEEDDED